MREMMMLKKNTVVKSISLRFCFLMRAVPKPLSTKEFEREKKIPNTAMVPKSDGARSLAKTKPHKNRMPWFANFSIPLQNTLLIVLVFIDSIFNVKFPQTGKDSSKRGEIILCLSHGIPLTSA